MKVDTTQEGKAIVEKLDSSPAANGVKMEDEDTVVGFGLMS